MSTVAIIDPAIYTDPAVTRRARELHGYMAGKVDPNGITHVSDARIMADLRWSQRTVTRARADLLRTRWAVKLGGGYRGTASVVRIVATFTRDTARRALASLAASARDRAAIRATFRVAKKVANRGYPTTTTSVVQPSGALHAPAPTPKPLAALPNAHYFEPDDYNLFCRRCGLPRRNRAHVQ